MHMFGLAYVILPFTDRSPADAITQSLARFQRGRRGDLPEEWLRFHDDTADLRTAYETTHTFSHDKGLRRDGGSDWLLSTVAIMAAMKERGREHWTVRFADIEPDFAAFVDQYCAFSCDRHPVTGGFGRWLNDLGQWDWWELGGCFNGAITGHERGNGIPRTAISSGYSEGRQAFEMLAGALADACGDELPEEIDIVSDDNIELVTTLSAALEQGLGHAIPGALVLPSGSVPDAERWFDRWPELYWQTSPEANAAEKPTPWNEIVRSTYRRFHDHWAAAVSYHF